MSVRIEIFENDNYEIVRGVVNQFLARLDSDETAAPQLSTSATSVGHITYTIMVTVHTLEL